METEPERGAVLLIVDEVVEDDAFERRRLHRDWQALMPVPEVPTADDVQGLRRAMGFEGGGLGRDQARYHRVCIVAFPSSPVRRWVAAFFAAEMPWLIGHAGLCCCVPPFDIRHTTPVTVAGAEQLAADWERLRPADEPARPRQGGGWWDGPPVAVLPADPHRFHLRGGYGRRRSLCGLRAGALEDPDPQLLLWDVPEDRRCPTCFRAWFDQIRPEREDDRRRLANRLEGVTGLLAAFDQLDAVNRAVIAAADWPAAHAVLTGPRFGFTDLQAFSILVLPAGRQTREGRADLQAEQAALQAGLTDLDAFLAAEPPIGTAPPG